ncbi:MAG: class I SAM-dependent methyltransferase, partial [Thermoguttaceae bacterium]
KNWANPIKQYAPFDLVISGLAIHHLPDAEKQTLYKQIFELLKPGGMFLHLERVSSKSPWAKEIFQEYFIDHLWSFHKQQGGAKTRDAVEEQFRNRPGRNVDLLAPLELQCRWLEEIGFTDVECFFKIFEIAIFGGIKQ